MTFDIFLSLLVYAFVASITPGPNNLMLLASGTNFGLRRTMPHVLGITLGFSFLLFMAGIGLGALFDSQPAIKPVLQIVALVYMLYLAWKIANAQPPQALEAEQKPFTFMQAVTFQWVNPKGIAMALTTVSLYVPNPDLKTLFIVVAVCGGVTLPSVIFWTVMGQQVSRILTKPKQLRIFNITMAVMLIGSLYWVLDL